SSGGSHTLTPSSGWDALTAGTYTCPITYSSPGNPNLVVQVTANKTSAPSSGNTVSVDSSINSPDLSNQISGSWSHTTSGNDRYLVVGLSGWDNTSSLTGVIVSYAGVPMTKLGGVQTSGQNNAVLWGLVNPAIGTNTVSISNIPSGYTELGGGSISFTNVNQTVSTGSLVKEPVGGDASVKVTLATGDLGVDILYSGSGTQAPVVGANGIMRVNMNLLSPQTEKWLMMATEGGTGTVTMSWTDAGGADFAQVAIPIKVAVGATAKSESFIPVAVSQKQLTRQLEIGAKGEDVIALQSFLANYDSVYPEKLTTGYFGILTANAISAFQNMHNLPQVGRVGPLTLQKLREVMASWNQ
ncbi:MAG: peptidoglycan-binding domain-containing protein, partial [Minisyncoccia bacterium]